MTIRWIFLTPPLLLLLLLLASPFVVVVVVNGNDGGRTIDDIFREAMTTGATNKTSSILGDAAASEQQYANEENQSSGNEVFVGVYYYAWHANDFHRGDGYLRDQLSEKQPPLLGEYDDRQKDIIAQHLLWSRRANVRLWVCSWWGPSSREDLTIRNNILTHPDLGFQQESNHKIALLYEISGRGLKESANWDTSNSYDDLAYICKNYFDHPNYYQLNEKSVIVIYLTRKLLAAGVLEVVLTDMRKAAKETCGTDIFIIGDHVWNFPPNIDDGEIYWPLIPGKYLDAVTNYDVYGNVGVTPYAGSVAIDKHWDKEATAWKRFANVRGVAYIPGTSAGYNDRGIRPENDNPGLSRKLGGPEDEHGSLFAAHLVKARKLVETKDILSDPLLLVNSWNEWHEDSQIEPITVDGGYTNEPEILTSGLDYESYGFKYLDILRRATCGNDTDINDNELGLLFHEAGSEGTSKSCTTARRYATSSIVATDDGPRIVDFTGDTKTAVSLILQHDPFKTDPPPNDVLVGILYYPIESNRLNFRSQIGGQTIVGEKDGNYDKIDRDTIQRHLKLSQQANIGMWVISWYGSGTGSDSSLRNLILSEEGLGESDMQIILIYQIRDRIPNFRTVKPSLWDWSKVESDIESLCNTDDGILNHPNYFRVGKDNEIKRPVLILGLTRWFYQEGELSTLVSKIRNKVKEKCSDFVTGGVALIGDQVWKSAPVVSNNYDSFQNNDGDDDGKNYAPFDLLDAVMNIDVSSNMGRKGYAGSDAVDSFYQEQREWRDAAWRGKCGYVPSVIPGYNNRASTGNYQSPITARRLDVDSEEGSFFDKSVESATYLVDSTFNNLLIVVSFNRFSEDTQIEPITGKNSSIPDSLTDGIQYEGYENLYLDILKKRTENNYDIGNSSDINGDTSAAFYPLQCNLVNELRKDTCDLQWTDLFGIPDQKELGYQNLIMIPCGRCVVINRDSFPNIDRDNIIELKFARGIEIMGMLYIAGEDIQIKILTPFIRVLGEFHIDAGGVSVNGTPNVELILGDKNNTDLSPMEKFFPPSSNAYACGISRCEPKPKSIFVGGGKLKFRGLSPNTPTSIPLEGVISSTQEKNTTAKKHKCPSGGILFNKPFLDGSNNDTTRKRNLSKTAIKSVDVTGTLSELLNRRRTLVESDLKIDMTDIKGCLEASSSSDYELVMEVRLIRDGYDGEATLCGTKCIKIFSEYMIDNISIENQVSILKDANQTIALDYGQWSELKTTITFTEEELSTSNIYFGLRIESSDESSIMDISTTVLEIDQFRLQLAPEKACGMKTEICRELVPCNGHAEYNYAQMPFSGLGNDLSPIIQYDEKDKNRYWFSKSEGNISWVVPTECLTEDALYSLAMRVRAFREEGDNNTIFNYGKPPPAENLPLGLCEGDCDNDGMCAGEMVCFQRESGNEPVRYCKGGTEDNSLTDYCTYPIANVTIRSSATEDVPLLGFCEGDCDTDADCAQGLKCFQRNGNEDVPFCAGGKEDKSRTDYCTHIVDVVSDVDSSIEEENSATVQLLIFLKIQNLDGNVVIKQVADCTGLLDQWVNCYGSFRVGTAEISKNINPNDIHTMYIVATTGTGTNLSYGVDDISVHLSNGGIPTPDKVTDLVVSKSIEDYWLPGSEILVSHRMSSENIARRTVFDVEPYDDDRVLISLDTPISSWPPQEWADDQNNVDIILLSRNLAIVDGIITIYRTPTVAQIVQGVEFRRNSTGSQPSSSAVDFDRCKQNEASVLSNNTIFNISSVSSVPTKDTTDSPSEAPTVLCQDDKSFRFKGKKKCRWVGKKSGRRCKRKHLGNFIRKYCPKTCGIC